jgi:hypothetical protein
VVDHPALGRIRLAANPLQFSRSRLGPGLPPPLLGEHTDEVRRAVTGGDPQAVTGGDPQAVTGDRQAVTGDRQGDAR